MDNKTYRFLKALQKEEARHQAEVERTNIAFAIGITLIAAVVILVAMLGAV